MNMKKIMAGVVAATLAVGTMAVAASAVEYESTYTHQVTADKININDDGTFYSQLQVGHVAEVTVTATYTTADGATGYALIGPNWGEPTEEANAVTLTGAWNGAGFGLPEDVVEAAAGDFSTVTLDFTVEVTDINADVQKQSDDWGEEAIADIQILKIGGSSAYAGGKGTIGIAEVAGSADEGGEAETNETNETSETNETDNTTDNTTDTTTAATGNTATPTADKTNADTGVEGVAVVAGLAIVAAGAVVVAKKRK